MSKALHQIAPGTVCTIKSSGEEGELKKIFYYPTKYEVELKSGKIHHYTSHEVTFEGVEHPDVKLKTPEIPHAGIGDKWSSWHPFTARSQIKHHFSTTKEIMWKMITNLDTYNIWFVGIQRALPILSSNRYVHQFSFDKFATEPGAFFKIRPSSLAPYFKCRIMTTEKEKEFGFEFRTSPFYKEYISFKINESKKGVWVTCSRTSSGVFSLLSLYNWNDRKSKILQILSSITPKVDFDQDKDELSKDDRKALQWGGFSSREDYINYAVNMGLKGNMDIINSISDKPTRGKAKAALVRAKRTGESPPMPEKPKGGASPVPDRSSTNLSGEHLIAFVVNKALDGDKDHLNAIADKVTRGKAKALLVKIKRGSAERPTIPELPSKVQGDPSFTAPEETVEQLVERLISKGLEGDMEEINTLDNKVLRGKIKAAILKAKREKNN